MFQFKKGLGEYLFSTYNDRERGFVFSVLIVNMTSVVHTLSVVTFSLFGIRWKSTFVEEIYQ